MIQDQHATGSFSGNALMQYAGKFDGGSTYMTQEVFHATEMEGISAEGGPSAPSEEDICALTLPSETVVKAFRGIVDSVAGRRVYISATDERSKAHFAVCSERMFQPHSPVPGMPFLYVLSRTGDTEKDDRELIGRVLIEPADGRYQ